MNFFKSVFSEDPDSSDPDNSESSSRSQPDDQHEQEQEQDQEQEQEQEPSLDDHNPNPNPNALLTATAVWSFGGLMKTLASRSESVIQTYRRDLEEFGSGLKKETSVIREVASRAVKDLPGSLEIGASVAQESLESVGQVIDDFGSSVWKGTAEIITHGKDAILAVDQDTDYSSDNNNDSSSNINNTSDLNLGSKPYSRFDAQLRVIQYDANTYCEEPEDFDDYNKWKLGFLIDDKREEIESLIEKNGVMEEIYTKLVPSVIDHESFWSRYFYRVYKLKQAEDARAKLVKRAISGEEDEDLSWDFDDEEDEENKGFVAKDDLVVNRDFGNKDSGDKDLQVGIAGNVEKSLQSEDDKRGVIESINDDGADHKVTLEGRSDLSEMKADKSEAKSDDKMLAEGKIDGGESCKDSDVSVVSTQPSLPEVEDLGWDEIEDIGSGDENKAVVSGSSNKVDLRKRLSTAEEEEEEDLSWDIEDDDEPIKSRT